MRKLRDNCSVTELRAHAILDAVRAGLRMKSNAVRWALLVLGDL